jgi:hypothetical protein
MPAGRAAEFNHHRPWQCVDFRARGLVFGVGFGEGHVPGG